MVIGKSGKILVLYGHWRGAKVDLKKRYTKHNIFRSSGSGQRIALLKSFTAGVLSETVLVHPDGESNRGSRDLMRRCQRMTSFSVLALSTGRQTNR